jgi:hypothetical protein
VSPDPRDPAPFRFAREYTLSLLADIPDDRWFDRPGGVTHVAWQVGHLASAELRLGLIRVRDPRPVDDEIFPPDVRRYFVGDDTPRADPREYPSPARFREILAAVRRQLFAELPTYADSTLAEPLGTPHRLCRTKGDALVWAPRHELIHAGQIGLLRRLLGRKPVW